MTIRGWKTKFDEIRKDFGYSEKEDLISAKKLNLLLKRKPSEKEFQNIIKGKTVLFSIIFCNFFFENLFFNNESNFFAERKSSLSKYPNSFLISLNFVFHPCIVISLK